MKSGLQTILSHVSTIRFEFVKNQIIYFKQTLSRMLLFACFHYEHYIYIVTQDIIDLISLEKRL